MAKKRRRRRKNPGTLSWGDAALLVLGAAGTAAASFAIEGQALSKMTVGLIQVGVGLVGGGLASLVSPGLAGGVAGAGLGMGVKNIGADALMMTATPKSKGATGSDVSAVRARTRAIQAGAGRNRRMLPASSALESAAMKMGAIRTRM